VIVHGDCIEAIAHWQRVKDSEPLTLSMDTAA